MYRHTHVPKLTQPSSLVAELDKSETEPNIFKTISNFTCLALQRDKHYTTRWTASKTGYFLRAKSTGKEVYYKHLNN